jgi:hypothetical protein
MASSSSASSVISIESETTQEVTPEFDPIAAYEASAPLHWDAEEWDFRTWSEDDESRTDGEDLQLLLGGELDKDDDDDMSWEGISPPRRKKSTTHRPRKDSTAGGFLRGGLSEDDEETDGRIGYSSDSGRDDGSDNSDTSAAPLIKHRKVSGTYWW